MSQPNSSAMPHRRDVHLALQQDLLVGQIRVVIRDP